MPLTSLLTFVAAAAAVGGIYSIVADLFLRDQSRVKERISEEFRQQQRERAERSILFRNLGQVVAEARAEGRDELSSRRRFEQWVEQSGLDITPGRIVTLSAIGGIGAGLVFGLLRGSIVVGIVLGAAAALIPLLYVHLKRNARMEKLRQQLPDAFDLMGRVIRAGQTMAQAMRAVAEEFSPPVAEEFSYCFEQQNLGLPPDVTLRDLAQRTGILEIKIFVLALTVQQQTGGNLAELLDKLSHVIRERFRIQGAIKSLTAEGRMQAAVLLALPPLIFLVMLFLNPSYARILLDYPKLLIATLLCEGLGALWIRKIVNFDF
ncbi:MAG TPA: type II secretion system F family protein [Isosphaeraceae bacterium]